MANINLIHIIVNNIFLDTVREKENAEKQDKMDESTIHSDLHRGNGYLIYNGGQGESMGNNLGIVRIREKISFTENGKPVRYEVEVDIGETVNIYRIQRITETIYVVIPSLHLEKIQKEHLQIVRDKMVKEGILQEDTIIISIND